MGTPEYLSTARPEPSSERKLLCFVGPMVGFNPGRVTTQGERLAELFAGDGYAVEAVSRSPNRYLRLFDIIQFLIRHRRRIRVQMLQVFSGWSFVVEDVSSLLGKLFGHRLVMTIRGGNMPVFIARFPRWSRRVLARADAIIVPSDYLARTMRRYGYSSRVIPNIINMDRYIYRHRTRLQPRLLWMRAFHPETYNPAMAVRVLARVRRAIPNATLVMAGQNDPAQRQIEQMVRDLGLRSAVRFPGFLSMEDKAREGAAADIFINTNYIDNMPVSVVEAFAQGLPVVATSVGGIPDLITHEETGLLVPADADGAMADAIIRLLRDPELAGRLSANGRRFAEGCAWPYVRGHYATLLDEVAGPGLRDP
jgi:glycosyltransferase involved in cell wall biosynthesis